MGQNKFSISAQNFLLNPNTFPSPSQEDIYHWLSLDKIRRASETLYSLVACKRQASHPSEAIALLREVTSLHLTLL